MKEHNGKTYVEKERHDLNELLEIVKILRSENGCPWDRKQTFESLKECLSNESKEIFRAVDANDYENLCEELGDVLLQVLMNSEIAQEKGLFDFSDVVQTLTEKLIRRHPHVFGDVENPTTAEEGLKLWKSVKAKEKEEKLKKAENKK